MKLYTGPFKSKNYSIETAPARRIDTFETYTDINGYSAYVSTPGRLPADTEVFSSLYAPKYYALVADGWIIQCPYQKVNTMWTWSTGTVADTVYIGDTGARVTGVYANLQAYAQTPSKFPLPPNLISERTAALNEASTRVWSKANTMNADLLIELTQLKGTVEMFVTLVSRLVKLALTPGAILDVAKFLSETRNGRHNRRVRAYPDYDYRMLDELAGLWCEMRFGWRPLMSSLDGVIKSLTDPDMGKEKRVTHRASETFSREWFQTIAHPVTAGTPFTTYQNCTTEMSHKSVFRAGILVAESIDLASSLGLSKDQILIAFWDLIPLSFILDRFVNVGNWLRSIVPKPNRSFGGSWCVERFSTVITYRSEWLPTDQSSGSGSSYKRWIREGVTEAARVQTEGVYRVILDKPPSLPTIRWDWSIINDIYNAVDGAMLAIQRIPSALSRLHRR